MACSSRRRSPLSSRPSGASTISARPPSAARRASRSRAVSSSSAASSGSGAHRQAPAVGAGDHEQVVGQAGQPLGLLAGAGHRAPQLGHGPGAAVGQLQLGPEDGQRRAELVAGVGDEVALALQRPVDALEHLVERLAQPAHLVPGLGHGQPGPGLRAGDLGGPAAHRLDRLQGRPATPYPAIEASSTVTGPPMIRSTLRFSSAPSRSMRGVPITSANRPVAGLHAASPTPAGGSRRAARRPWSGAAAAGPGPARPGRSAAGGARGGSRRRSARGRR